MRSAGGLSRQEAAMPKIVITTVDEYEAATAEVQRLTGK